MTTFKKISDLEAISIVSNGIFYFPAWKHHYNPSTEVYCDYCNKSNLLSSIGYRNMDLCLECVELLTNAIKKNNVQCNNITLPTDNIGNAPNNIGPIPNNIINQNNQENKYSETTVNNNKIIELKPNETLTIISGNVNIVGSNVNLTNSSNNLPNQTIPNQFVPNQFVPNQFIPNQFVPNQFVPNQFVPNQNIPTTNLQTTNANNIMNFTPIEQIKQPINFWNTKQETTKTNQNNFTIPTTVSTNTFGFNSSIPTTTQIEKK
jgi:hypothetical protein